MLEAQAAARRAAPCRKLLQAPASVVTPLRHGSKLLPHIHRLAPQELLALWDKGEREQKGKQHGLVRAQDGGGVN